jgi:hydroxypyruvate isomerase
VNSPSVGLIFDIYHVQVMDGDILRNLERCWRRIVAIQFADNPGRTEAGSGELNWINVFRYIANHRFDGLVEMEHEILGNSIESERRALEALWAINASI